MIYMHAKYQKPSPYIKRDMSTLKLSVIWWRKPEYPEETTDVSVTQHEWPLTKVNSC